ncbi:hypothetical protein [Halovenus marina]|uniref:hypothetical protein n=1 Tax=Halovenus marina TaxID=3396621 RepID=UPI003F544537
MRRHALTQLCAAIFIVLTFVLGFAFVFATGASAQVQDGGNETDADQQPAERIDQNTVIHDYGYNEERGTAWVVIESDRLQSITVTDGGGLLAGGTVDQETVTVKPDERTRLSVSATETDGYVALSIATDQTLYGLPIEIPDPMFTSDPGWDTVRLVAIGSGVGVLVAVVLDVWRRKRGGRNGVYRIA